MPAALLLLLGLLPVGPTVSDTEHQLMLLARQHGQWSAFRAYMAPEAWLLDPDVQQAALVLDRRPEQPQSRLWWPARSVTSCDGGLALSTGPYRGPGGKGGRFFTVWERQPSRDWRWVFDGTIEESEIGPAGDTVSATVALCGKPVPAPPDETSEASGASADGTLRWALVHAADRDRHRLVVSYLTAEGWKTFEDATVS